MSIKRGLLALVACSGLASGCQFYFGSGDDAPGVPDAGLPCNYGADGVAVPQGPSLRNPYTGDCVSDGSGGCYGMNGGPAPGGGADVWYDSRWPVCENYCNQLDENDCLVADGCRAIYVDGCPYGAGCGPANTIKFDTCWAVGASGPVRGGDCTAIVDALECADHDDCAAVHELRADGQPGAFRQCQPDPSVVDPGVCWDDTTCPMGQHCDKINYCELPPGCQPGDGCPPVCYGKCVPDPPPPPPPPPPACDGLDEARCIDMSDGCIDWNGQPSCGTSKCQPIYAGSNCTCSAAGACTCQSWSFEMCRKAQ
jgi:hypothetical protein